MANKHLIHAKSNVVVPSTYVNKNDSTDIITAEAYEQLTPSQQENYEVATSNPKLPEPSRIELGELAVNYAAGNERISLKNSNSEVVEFVTKEYVDTYAGGNQVEIGTTDPTDEDILLFVDTDETPVPVEVYSKTEVNTMIYGQGTIPVNPPTIITEDYTYTPQGGTPITITQAMTNAENAVTDLAYDTTNKKLTKKTGGSATPADVVTSSTIVTDGINVVNGSTDLSWGTDVTVGTVQGTNITAKLPLNPNTDKTAVKLGTVTGVKKTDSTVISADSSTGLTIEGGTNLFKIGNGTNYIEVAVASSTSGDVTGPSSSVAEHVATFSDTTGKVIKDSGYMIASDVPQNAVFTDTTYTFAEGTTIGAFQVTPSGGTAISVPVHGVIKGDVQVTVVNSNLNNQGPTSSDIGVGEQTHWIYANSGSTTDYTIALKTIYKTPTGEAISLTCPQNGYCEVNFFRGPDINNEPQIYARGL